tara:strand:- start:128 stop:277 length:150 start_codon:yes stop_codon:yes gene_type:complete
MPEQARQQQGLLQQQQQVTPQMAQMGQRSQGGQMPMPTARMAAQQGLLR